MASVRTDNVQIKLDIDGSQSKTELDNLTRKAQLIKNDLKEMKRGTEDYITANKELRQVNARIEELHKELGTAGLSMNQLSNRSRQLNRELKDLTPGTEAFISKSRQLAEVDTRLDQLKTDVRGIKDELDKSGGGFLDFVKKGAAIGGIALGVEAAVSALKQLGSESIDAAAKGSDSIADMEKSLNITTEEAKALREQLEGIDTRTSQENLEAIAVAGGQLGVLVEDVDEFTESVNQANVALGDEFTGGVEDVTKSIGGLQQLFKETAALKPDQAITKIGSALNALGADGRATGPVVAEFTARIGQLGDLAPEITQTLGLGAAFQELGLSAEISSGGLTNVLLTAAKDTAGFAKQIGITDKEFQKLVNSDPNEVILQLADSFKGASETEIIQTLDSLGIKSQEATKVMSLLASQTDFVRQKQALAAEEFRKGTSLYDEFLKKNTNDAARVEIAEKAYARFRRELGEQLIPIYIRFLQLGGFAIEVLRALPQFVSENRIAFGLLALAVLAFNKAQIVEQATTLRSLAIKKLVALELLVEEAGTYKLVSAKTLLTRAQVGLNAAMRANPIGLIITVIALAVLAFNKLYDSSERVRETVAGLANVAKVVFTNIKETALETLGGVGLLIAGVFTGNLKMIQEGLSGLKGVGAKVSAAYHEGFQAQEAKEHAAAVQKTKEREEVKQKLEEDNAKKRLAASREELIEQLKLQQAALEQKLAKAAEGSEQELKLKKQLVLVARDIDLQADKKTEGDKAIIRGKAQIELDKLNREYAKKQEENRKKEADKTAKQAEEEAKAALDIEKRKTALIDNEYDRRAAELLLAANEEKRKLTGTAEQIAEARVLIDKQYKKDALANEKARVDAQISIMRQLEQEEAARALRQAQRKRGETGDDGNPFNDVQPLEGEKAAALKELDARHEAEIANAKLTAAEKTQINKDYQETRANLEKDYDLQIRYAKLEEAASAVQVSQQATQVLFDFKKIANDKEQQEVEKDRKLRMQRLDLEFKSGKISKEQYEKQKSAIESNYDQKTRSLKRKAAEDEKASNIAQTIMAGVLATLKASQNPLGFLSPTAIATAAFSALSLIKVMATPVPTFAKGGLVGSLWHGAKQSVGEAYRSARRYASGGRINPVAGVPSVGQLHSNDGIQMIDGKTGEHIGEWERGEPYMILSRDTYKNNREVVDALLDTSLHRGGAPIGRRGGIHAADGAVVGNLPAAQSRNIADQAEVVSAIKENTAVMLEIARQPVPAVINWGQDDTQNVQESLAERQSIQDGYSA